MKNNFYLTIVITLICCVLALYFLDFSYAGFAIGILYAQIIEWFVHGWIQHHPFRIFKAYRDNHTYHHKHPNEPLSVQPIQYFLIGSVFLLAPFCCLDGAILGYLTAYLFINVIHHDLHIKDRLLPNFLWRTLYFRWIIIHHERHHRNVDHSYTTYSVTNPFIDVIFSKIKFHKMNNWIAKNLKI